MKKDELRNVPLKNYIILGVVIVITFLVLYYLYMWLVAYNETKLNKPIIDKYMSVINYNELDDYLVENPDSIIYVSVLEDQEIRNFEIEFKKSLKKHQIKYDLLYLDLTDELKDEKMSNDVKNKYLFNSLNLSDVPCVVVFQEGQLKYIYGLKDNDYDVVRMVSFINDIDFGEDNG